MRALLGATLVAITGWTQAQSDNLTVHFDFDKDQLKDHQKTRLLSRIDSLGQLENTFITSVSLTGHTDDFGDDTYNDELARRRTAHVQQLLQNNRIGSELIKHNAFGEREPMCDNNSISNRAKNRRVEIAFILRHKEIAEVPEEPKKPDPCKGDTTVVLPEGTMMIMNKCEYRRQKGCIKLDDYRSQDKIRQAGLTTQDVGGNQLESAGMINIQTCDGGCLEHPVTVRVPVGPCGPIPGMNLYDVRESGDWEVRDDGDVELVEINGELYYQYKVRCPGKKNLDKRAPMAKRKFKLKSKEGMKILEAYLSAPCPSTHVQIYPKKPKDYGKAKRKIKYKVACPGSEPDVMVTVVTKENDTLTMPYTNMGDLQRKHVCGTCREKPNRVGQFLLLFPIWQKTLYRKYLIRKDNVYVPAEPENFKDAVENLEIDDSDEE